MAKERKELRRGPIERLATLLMSGIFVYGGWEGFREPGGRAAKAEKLGLSNPELMVRVNALTMMGAGTALALGIKPKLTSLILAGTLVPTTMAGHRFWEEGDPKGRSMQMTQFFKNLGILGGLLILLSKRRSVRVPVCEPAGG
jgi:putative oxidoreductase